MMEDKKRALNKFSRTLAEKGYKSSTCRVYSGALRHFFNECLKAGVNVRDSGESAEFLGLLLEKKSVTQSSYASIIQALKIYYREKRSPGLMMNTGLRVRGRADAPFAYTRDEIRKIIVSSPDTRQKAIITLVYACGLGLSEAWSLRISDLDYASKTVHIGSGRKERYVMLPDKVIKTLNDYMIIYKPGIWLFESRKGSRYCRRSMEISFRKALVCSGIGIRGSFRSLRHSFASHMLESGTDIYLLQRLMGHSSIRSTRNYLKISSVKIGRVKSPIEDL